VRIVLTGSHSTGKTSLANAVRDSLRADGVSDVEVIREVGRDLIDCGVPLNKDITSDACVRYITTQLQRERGCTARHAISDRSLLDLLAYVVVNDDCRTPTSYRMMLEEIVHVEALRFDRYVFLPVEFALIPDAVRPLGEEYRQAVSDTIRQLLARFKFPMVEIRGTLPGRVEQLVTLFQREP
jgi:nicotinamide riboside kinase